MIIILIKIQRMIWIIILEVIFIMDNLKNKIKRLLFKIKENRKKQNNEIHLVKIFYKNFNKRIFFKKEIIII